MRTVQILIPVAMGLVTTALPADEVRLKDGRTLVGPTVTAGDHLVVQTTEGKVTVARDEVARHRTDAELRAEFEGLAARTAETGFGHLQLARVARDCGLYPEMWHQVERVLGQPRRDEATQSRLAAFLAELEPIVLPHKWRRASTEIRVHELLRRLQPRPAPGLAAAVEELLVAEPDADPFLRGHARGASRDSRRIAAVRAMARRGAQGNDRFVYRTAILDRAGAVRTAAARAIREHGTTADAVRYLAPGLMHTSPAVRIRTAEAYGRIGDTAAIDHLVAAGPHAGALRAGSDAGATRGNIAILEQRSYIRDFDVEVAQASFIADPKIDVLQSGVVLDVTVAAVTRHRGAIVGAYRNALRHLAGSDPGRRTADWAAWHDARRAQSAAPATAVRR